MKKTMIALSLISLSFVSLSAKNVIDEEVKFNQKMAIEGKRVIKAYDAKIKKNAREGNLDKAQALKDKKEAFVRKVSAILNNDKQEQLKQAIKGKDFIWGHGNIKHEMELEKSGKIGKWVNTNESFWDVNDAGQLVILNASKKVQWTFTKEEKRKGKWYFETESGHYLLQD